MEKSKLPNITIQSASERLALPKSTLRYWEKALPALIRPERTAGGQRRYTLKDMAVFETVRDLRKAGYSLVQIKERLGEGSENGPELDPLTIDAFAERIASAFRRELYHLLNFKIKA